MYFALRKTKDFSKILQNGHLIEIFASAFMLINKLFQRTVALNIGVHTKFSCAEYIIY